MSEDIKKEILTAAAENADVKTTVQKVLELSSEDQASLKQMLQEDESDPVEGEAEERNTPGAGFAT